MTHKYHVQYVLSCGHVLAGIHVIKIKYLIMVAHDLNELLLLFESNVLHHVWLVCVQQHVF